MESKLLGLIFLASGFLLIIGYIAYLAITRFARINPVVAISLALILIGIIIILISIAIERQREVKKLKEDFKKEDLRP